jgi:hypothetical protein
MKKVFVRKEGLHRLAYNRKKGSRLKGTLMLCKERLTLLSMLAIQMDSDSQYRSIEKSFVRCPHGDA